MDHEARDDAMESAALIGQGLPILAHPMLARAQLPEVLSCRRHGILVQLKDYSAPLVLPKWRNIKVHSGPVRPGRFLQVLSTMSAAMSAHKSEVLKHNALKLEIAFMLIDGLMQALSVQPPCWALPLALAALFAVLGLEGLLCEKM